MLLKPKKQSLSARASKQANPFVLIGMNWNENAG
jgi:hypothetical protein